MVQTARRQFVGIVLSSAVLQTANRQAGAEEPNPYVRANTDWLAKCRFGIGIHWTAQTVPRHDHPKPFQKAVADFDLKVFMATVEHAGADNKSACRKSRRPHALATRQSTCFEMPSATVSSRWAWAG